MSCIKYSEAHNMHNIPRHVVVHVYVMYVYIYNIYYIYIYMYMYMYITCVHMPTTVCILLHTVLLLLFIEFKMFLWFYKFLRNKCYLMIQCIVLIQSFTSRCISTRQRCQRIPFSVISSHKLRITIQFWHTS